MSSTNARRWIGVIAAATLGIGDLIVLDGDRRPRLGPIQGIVEPDRIDGSHTALDDAAARGSRAASTPGIGGFGPREYGDPGFGDRGCRNA